MNKILISLCIILFQLHTPLQAARNKVSISDILQEIQLLQKELGSLQNQSLQNNPSAQQIFQTIQGMQDELSNLQSQAHDLLNTDSNQNTSIQAPPMDLNLLNKISPSKIKRAHEEPSFQQPAPISSMPNNNIQPNITTNAPTTPMSQIQSNNLQPNNTANTQSSPMQNNNIQPNSTTNAPTTPMSQIQNNNLQFNNTASTQSSPMQKNNIQPNTTTNALPALNHFSNFFGGSSSSTPTTKSATSNNAGVKTQSMENGKDDFSDDNQNDQEATTLHVADQENQNDANQDPNKKSHQSFFLGEGMVNVQALELPQLNQQASAQVATSPQINALSDETLVQTITASPQATATSSVAPINLFVAPTTISKPAPMTVPSLTLSSSGISYSSSTSSGSTAKDVPEKPANDVKLQLIGSPSQSSTHANNANIKTQSMENGKKDFSDDNQNDQEATTLHVADQENQNDANQDPNKKSHQSFFLGEGMVNVQALSHSTDAFNARSKKDKKIGSYKRSLNYVQGYSLGTLTIGKKNIQVLEDNASTRIPITAVIQKGISKKPTAYIKNPGYNKMLKKSPAIINLYEYKP